MDTLKAHNDLLAGGFNEAQANAIINIVQRTQGDTATKGDIELAMSVLRTEIASAKNALVMWQAGIALALFGALKLVH